MNKFLSLGLVLIMVFSYSYSFAEKANSPISITSLEDIKLHEYHEGEEYGLKNTFILENSNIRAICYRCGKPGMTINTKVEEWGPIPIPCHAMDFAGISDLLIEYKYFNGEKHNSCGLNTSAYSHSIWKVYCQNGDDLGLNNTTFTIGQGQNIHCLIDPNNPFRHPFH